MMTSERYNLKDVSKYNLYDKRFAAATFFNCLIWKVLSALERYKEVACELDRRGISSPTSVSSTVVESDKQLYIILLKC